MDDCSLISSWDSLVHQLIIKSKEGLEQEVGKEDNNALVRKDIICGSHLPLEERDEHFLTSDITSELVKKMSHP